MADSQEAPRVAILLAVFNGEPYLTEQIESLLAQSHQDFVIVSRDDGSSDGSVQVLRHYARLEPRRFHLLPGGDARRGAAASFALLMDYVLRHREALGLLRADMCFCDQDDIWEPDKLRQSMQRLRNLEGMPDVSTQASSAAGTKPVLIHSDLRVVSETLDELAPSFREYQGLKDGSPSLGRLLVSNTVTGCTCLFNEALARRALPFPEQAIMHDWWLALVAAAFGELAYIDQPLVQYRQHENNTLGARKHHSGRLIAPDLLRRVLDRSNGPIYLALARQARAFLVRYRNEMSPGQRVRARLATILAFDVPLVQKSLFRILRRL